MTSSDPRFLDTTLEEMKADYWAHHYADNPKLLERDEDEDFDQSAIMQQWAAEEDDEPDDWEDVK